MKIARLIANRWVCKTFCYFIKPELSPFYEKRYLSSEMHFVIC